MRGDADDWWAYAKDEKDTAAVLMAAERWRACYHHAGKVWNSLSRRSTFAATLWL